MSKQADSVYQKYCSVCGHNKGRAGDQVNCGYARAMVPLTFECCAAQILTEDGWLDRGHAVNGEGKSIGKLE